jgi:hypothetical protein
MKEEIDGKERQKMVEMLECGELPFLQPRGVKKTSKLPPQHQSWSIVLIW